MTERSSLLRLPTTTTVSATSKSSGRITVALAVSPYAVVTAVSCGVNPAMLAAAVHDPGRTAVNVAAPAPSVALSISVPSGPRICTSAPGRAPPSVSRIVTVSAVARRPVIRRLSAVVPPGAIATLSVCVRRPAASRRSS